MRRPTWFMTAIVAGGLIVGACGGAAAPPTVAPTAPPPPTATTAPIPTIVPTVAPTATTAPIPTTVPTTAPLAAPSVPKVPISGGLPTPSTKPAAKQGVPTGGGAGAGVAAMAPGLLGSLKSSPATSKPASSPLAKETEKALGQIKSFRMTGDIVVKEQGKVDLMLEYVAPDKLNLTVRLDAAMVAKNPDLGGLDSFAAILLGDTLYLKFGPEWTKIEGEPTPAGAKEEDVDLGKALVSALNEPGVTKVGSETLNGEPCDIYEFKEAKASFRLWVSTKDGFFRQMKGGDDEAQLNLIIRDINKAIEIKAPI